jgi:chromosome segregation ATPase
MSEEKIEKEIREVQEEIRREEHKIDELERKEERLIEREHNHHEVTITIDNKKYEVKKGVHTVAALKILAGVPPAKELEQIVHGVLTPLADNASVEICGGEMFISHARRGGSSHA